MPIVTSIKPQKNKKRVNIYLDGKFAFGLDLENYLKKGIKVEDELSDEDIEKIVKDTEFTKTSDKILRYLTLRPRSEREVQNWFYKHKVHESIQGVLLEKARKLDLLDDGKFAKWWVEQRLSFKPRGKRQLRSELFQKGISKEIIEDTLYQLEGEIDEVKIAEDLIVKNRYKWEKYDKQKTREKASNFLARKGFSWEIIKKVTGNKLFDE